MSMRLEEFALMPTGVDWEVWPDAQAPVPWSFDADTGIVQGPLELCAFRGRALLVTLQPGQVGLLTVDGGLRAVLLGGRHCLRVGAADEPARPGVSDGDGNRPRADGCPASARLMVIDTARPLRVRWGEASPLRCRDCPVRQADGRPGCEHGQAPGAETLRGDCEVLINNPVSFYHAFLRRAETVGEPFLCRLIGTLVQARLEELLADAEGNAEVGRRLAAMTPQQLERRLGAYGIACLAFACDSPAAEERSRAPLPSRQPPPVRDTEEVLVN